MHVALLFFHEPILKEENMKRRSRQKLSIRQQSLVQKIVIGGVIICFLWVLFAPGMGFFSWRKHTHEIEELSKKIEDLKEKNSVLQGEITRLKTDLEHFEQVARKKHDLVEKDEVLYKFKKDK